MTGVRGVSGGDGGRLLLLLLLPPAGRRRMAGRRNFLSRSRSGGVRAERMLVVDWAGEISRRGELPGGCRGSSRQSRIRSLTPGGRAAFPLLRHRRRNREMLIRASRPRPEHVAIAALAPVERSALGAVVGTGGATDEKGSVCSAPEGAVGVPLCVARIETAGVNAGVDSGVEAEIDAGVDVSDILAEVVVCADPCSLLCSPVAPYGGFGYVEQE